MDNEEKKVPDIPYIAHEAALARQERTIKKLWVLCILIFVAFVGSNLWWIHYENQFQDEVTTIEATQDGSAVNIVGGGDVNYGSESDNNE